MKLKQKAVVVVSITMILLVTLFLSFLRPVLLKESNDLDRDTAIGEVKRIENNIQSTLHNLGKINRDWSIWDDTYDFMVDQNPLYIERNLEPETFANLNINYIIYIDSEKKPKLQVGYDLDNKKIVPLQNDFYEEFLPAIKSRKY
ncbi:CHASE4 domain-containing protein [Psychrobacillus psychrotolerans]|uniref:CHASE4 domain-containing protein n=1 Tax=Psychrobacillus psychrotolerans TaxID=126156 RepID=UPI003988C6A0